MATTGAKFSLSGLLPKPKYTGEDEELPSHAQQKGPRIIDAREVESQQLVVKVQWTATCGAEHYTDKYQRTGPPAYGQRSGWRPRAAEDFGDGGAFPAVSYTHLTLPTKRIV